MSSFWSVRTKIRNYKDPYYGSQIDCNKLTKSIVRVYYSFGSKFSMHWSNVSTLHGLWWKSKLLNDIPKYIEVFCRHECQCQKYRFPVFILVVFLLYESHPRPLWSVFQLSTGEGHLRAMSPIVNKEGRCHTLPWAPHNGWSLRVSLKHHVSKITPSRHTWTDCRTYWLELEIGEVYNLTTKHRVPGVMFIVVIVCYRSHQALDVHLHL